MGKIGRKRREEGIDGGMRREGEEVSLSESDLLARSTLGEGNDSLRI